MGASQHDRGGVPPLSSVVEAITSVDAQLLREAVFMRPIRLAAPPSWVGHIPFAFWVVNALEPTVLVELGTHSGNSYAAFAQAVQRAGLGTACCAVDAGTNDPLADRAGESRFTEWSAFHDRHFSAFSRLVRSTFDEACPTFGDGSIDLLHINGVSTYDAVRHDFETWLPKMSARGVVLVHNIGVQQDGAGVWRCWEEMRRRYPSFAFLHGHGLGVLAVGRHLAPDIRWLVSHLPQRPQDAARVQQFFERLGATLERDFVVADLHERADELTASVTDLRALAREIIDEPKRKRHGDEDEPAAEDEHDPHAGEDAVATPRETMHTERVRLKATIEELDDARAASEKEAAALRMTVVQLEREQTTAARAIATLRRDLERTRAHWTWRLTSPFRGWGRLGFGPLLQVRTPRAAIAVLRLLANPRRLLELRSVTCSGLFDEHYYRARYPDVRRSGIPAAVHYVTAGAREGRAPHPLFDGECYLRRHPDVRAANANPLLHFIRTGQAEGRDPHPLFSVAYYRKQHPDLTQPIAPLLHFLSGDPHAGDTPHPLFDPAYYVEHVPDARAADVHPLVHFLKHGTPDGPSPHPLFDAAFYLKRYPDVRQAGHHPLLHYLEHVPGEDRDPHPLFDSSFYLDAAPDLAERGVNPLAHFIEHGWREGRRPNPAFDPRWYLAMNRDVAEAGANPLAHFDRYGWREGRDPSPELSLADYLAGEPDVAASGTNPLYHYLVHGARDDRPIRASRAATSRLPTPKSVRLRVEGTANLGASRLAPTIVCISHVIPCPPRAGNEVRVLRLLDWLATQGYRVLLVLAPLPTESVSDEQFETLVERLGNVVICDREGDVRYRLTSVPDVFEELDGRRTRSYASRLDEHPTQSRRALDHLRIERTYCHDVVIEVALEAIGRLNRVAVLSEYIWMTRLLPLVEPDVLKLVDTHDMYSTKASKVLSLGVADVHMSGDEEAARLARADVVLAIQEDERAMMQALVPSTEVVTVGIDLDPPKAATAAPEPHTVLIVGSGNGMNRTGLRDFLRFAWPSILARVPQATLLVAGRVGVEVPDDAPRVDKLGTVDDLTPLYARARVVVNPAAAGTGLKIKTVEALHHDRPVVTWPNGFDGIPDSIRRRMTLPGDWIEFADLVVGHLQAEHCGLDAETLSAVRAFVTPSAAYHELGERLTRYFGRRTGSADPSA